MSRFVYGLDPASKNDAFGIVVHELPFGVRVLPRLCAINKLTNTSFDMVYDYIVSNMFRRYPPFYVCIDYTNEKTFSDFLLTKYGKERVELITFSNANKLMLKEDGLSIMRQGYKFPNPNGIMAKSQPQVAQYVAELIQQLKHEQILATKTTGKTTFDHPPGMHNDLAIAWELSIHGCLRFMEGRSEAPIILSAKSVIDDVAEWLHQSRLEVDMKEKIKDNIMRRMDKLGFGGMVTDIKIDDEEI